MWAASGTRPAIGNRVARGAVSTLIEATWCDGSESRGPKDAAARAGWAVFIQVCKVWARMWAEQTGGQWQRRRLSCSDTAPCRYPWWATRPGWAGPRCQPSTLLVVPVSTAGATRCCCALPTSRGCRTRNYCSRGRSEMLVRLKMCRVASNGVELANVMLRVWAVVRSQQSEVAYLERWEAWLRGQWQVSAGQG